MKKNILHIITSIFMMLCSLQVHSQDKNFFRSVEDSLKTIAFSILNGKDDFVKYNANERFMILLESTLLTEKSFNYPFDSLKTIAHLTSADNKLKIFNWNLPKADGTYEYFGFIQVWNQRLKKYDVIKLIDKSDEITDPESKTLNHLNWYGAHYYNIIFIKHHTKRYYTLLGWDGNNKEICKKIIEVLTFDSKNKPIFGANIFKTDKKDKKAKKRIIFEYSASVSMSLKYEKQYIANGKDKNKMIVFDRLSPQYPHLTGMYQFYVPETNIFDAFLFKNNKWVLVKDIDARNKTPKRRNPKEQSQHNHNFKKDSSKN